MRDSRGSSGWSRRELGISALAATLVVRAFSAQAGPSMSSANNAISRDVDNGGGTYSASADYQLTGSVAEEVAVTTSASVHSVLRSGFSAIAYYPGTLLAATPLTTAPGVSASSVTLTWGTPGYDGNVGAALNGSSYLIQFASQVSLGNLANLNTIAVTVSTSGQAVGTSVGAGVTTGLDPNTTYYAQTFLRDNDGDVSGGAFTANYTTFTTLATAPTAGALEFLSIQASSVTVAWIGPYSLAVASMTNEGYILQGSSNNFGALAPAGAPVFSSSTFSSQASTLTLGVGAAPLDLSNTYYFQVGSLNWAGVPNYTTFTKLNFQLSQSNILLNFGSINPSVAMSTVSTSSTVITNVGNWPATITLTASTQTAGTPWSLAVSSGIDTIALYGEWNTGTAGGTVGPFASSFTTPLTTNTVASQAYPGNYATNGATGQSGYQIPVGQSSSLWVLMWLPKTTSTNSPQVLAISAQPIYP